MDSFRNSFRQFSEPCLEVVLNLAEITNRKRIKDQQVLVIHVVDLMPSVARNKQHSSRIDVKYFIINGDCPSA
jgi:hypothetical protein